MLKNISKWKSFVFLITIICGVHSSSYITPLLFLTVTGSKELWSFPVAETYSRCFYVWDLTARDTEGQTPFISTLGWVFQVFAQSSTEDYQYIVLVHVKSTQVIIFVKRQHYNIKLNRFMMTRYSHWEKCYSYLMRNSLIFFPQDFCNMKRKHAYIMLSNHPNLLLSAYRIGIIIIHLSQMYIKDLLNLPVCSGGCLHSFIGVNIMFDHHKPTLAERYFISYLKSK